MAKYVYESEQVDGLTVNLVSDLNPLNPREWDNLGTMACFHQRHSLGDKHGFTDPDSLHAHLKETDALFLPLYLYDHSGLSISTGPFSCPWDSGQIGYIYIERQRVRDEFNVKRIGKIIRERALNYLKNEVTGYNDYLQGNVYGFEVLDEEGNHVDSCYGFYGDKGQREAMEQGVDSAKWFIKDRRKKRQAKLVGMIRSGAPLEAREA